MAKPLVVLAALCLAACTTMSESDEATDETRRLISGDYASPAWVNDRFDGTHTRRLTGNRLKFSVNQTADGGGFDTAVGLAKDHDGHVNDVGENLTICFGYALDFSKDRPGKWWAGPKVSVNWAAMTDAPSTGAWYENYVVEIASQTPQELEADLFDYFDPVFLGESRMGGATYRHIKLRYRDWWQYWSIRQEWRQTGHLVISEILENWEGLPGGLAFDGIKANIETHGPVTGSGIIQAILDNDTSEDRLLSNCE